MKKYLFKPKRYGYGFVPISLGGWLATLLLLILVFISAYINNINSEFVTVSQGLRFLLDFIILLGLFTMWAEKYCDGDVRWRWGK